MLLPARWIVCALAAAALTLDLDATRHLTAGAPRPNAFGVDAPGFDLTLACEGSVAGAWVLTDVAIESAAKSPPKCPGRRIDGFAGYGTLMLNADGTFADTTAVTVNSTAFLPTNSRTPTCAQLQGEIAQHGVRSVSCTDDVAGACACAETIDPPSRGGYRFTGRYSLRGTSFRTPYRCAGRNMIRWRNTFEGNVLVLTAVRVES